MCTCKYLRYLRVWLSASLCISLGCSSVYETNLFLHPKKKLPHVFCSGGKKIQSSLMPLKQAPGGNFVWLIKCCNCGPLDFAASCLILFKTREANTASLLQKKWLALLLQAACGGEVQGTPSSWHSCKTGGVRGSAMLRNTVGSTCWPLGLWLQRMECPQGAQSESQKGDADTSDADDRAVLY